MVGHIAHIGEYLTPFVTPDLLRTYTELFPTETVYDLDGLSEEDIVSVVENWWSDPENTFRMVWGRGQTSNGYCMRLWLPKEVQSPFIFPTRVYMNFIFMSISLIHTLGVPFKGYDLTFVTWGGVQLPLKEMVSVTLHASPKTCTIHVYIAAH